MPPEEINPQATIEAPGGTSIPPAEAGAGVDYSAVFGAGADPAQRAGESPAEPVKRGRGRPPGSKSNKVKPKETPPDGVPSVQSLQTLIEGIFGVLARREGEYWRLDTAEASMLTDTTHECLVLYAPLLAKWLPLGSLCLVWGIVLIPRITETVEHTRAKKSGSILRPGPAAAPAA